MEKLGLTVFLISSILLGCGKKIEIANECVEMANYVKKMEESASEKSDKPSNEILEELKDKWSNLKVAQKEKATKDCKKALAIMKKLEDNQ